MCGCAGVRPPFRVASAIDSRRREDETSGWDQKGEVKPGFERSRFLASVLPEGRLVACRVGLPIRVRPQSGKGSHLMQSYHRMCLSFPAENPR